MQPRLFRLYLFGMRKRIFLLLASLAVNGSLMAGFPGTDLILPAVGRVEGIGGSHFYTTVWVTNPSADGVDVVIDFLRSGQDNQHPASVTVSIAPGETKTFENIAESLFGITGVLGAARVRASKPVLVSSRIYNQSDGQTLAGSEGLFYSAIPSDFAIAAGQTATLQGVMQDADFRYNIFLVESSGANATTQLTVHDGAGHTITVTTVSLLPYEQRLIPLSAMLPSNLTAGGIETTVVDGTGRVIVAGSLIANGSQDASGFEMGFRSELLGSATPGPQGPAGPQGPTGPQGLTGPQGPAGPQGSAGPPGAKGTDGATGLTGPQGPAGPAGAKGADGATGSTGQQGSAGPAGAKGADGATGPTGPQGPAGPAGAKGADGATGPTGLQGPAGPAGSKGADGATGPTGPQGPAGSNGVDGSAGPAGPQGPAGPAGATGPQGPTGPTGSVASLGGDVVGAPGSNSVAFVGGQPAANVAAAVATVAAATDSNVGTTIVRRDAGGSFTASNVTADGFVIVNNAAKIQSTSAGLFFGNGAGNTTGSSATNTGIGTSVLPSLTSGASNTGLGSSALMSMATGSNNTAIGDGALKSATGGFNAVAIGGAACAGVLTSGGQTCIGTNALNQLTGGVSDTAVGNAAGVFLTSGDNNTFIGGDAGHDLTSGSGNTLLGSAAGSQLTTGNSNVFVGASAGFNLTSGSGNIYAGNFGVASESSTIRIGSAQTSAYMAGVFGQSTAAGTAVFVDGSGKLGTIVSSRRYKEQIEDMGNRSDTIMRLRPVTFRYKPRYNGGSDDLQFGLIAEEVAEVDPALVLYGTDGKPQTVRYQYIAPLLLNEVQHQQKTIAEQQTLLTAQQSLIDELLRRVDRLETSH
jgi:Chaperone of endosialidase/Collagen triple helix repeat (20 copies)